MMRVMGLKCVKMEDMEESIKKIEFFGREMVPNHDTVIFFKTYLQIFFTIFNYLFINEF